MKQIPRFFKCSECSTLVEALNPQCCDEMVCCKKPMELLVPNKLIALEEKHMPVVKRNGDTLTICVGRTLHPMTGEHCIKWIVLSGKDFEKRVYLKKGDDPIVTFDIGARTKELAVYAYCNLHGLWRYEL